MDVPSSNDDWCTIESDPGVFTEMLESLGCTSIELAELYSLDDDSLFELQSSTKAIYGFIFLFQWQENNNKNKNTRATTSTSPSSGTSIQEREPLDEFQIPENLFFAQQVTTNACATQAILSVLFNAATASSTTTVTSSSTTAITTTDDAAPLRKEELGTTLSEFQSFVHSFPPHLKGVAISSSDEIKQAHNNFAKADSLYLTQEIRIAKPDEEGAEAFHFIAYVPVDETVYELDGLQRGPIIIGRVNNDNEREGGGGGSSILKPWLLVARTAIQERMIAAGEENVKFNLMAVIHDKRSKMQEMLVQCTDDDQKEMLLAQLNIENTKREQWKIENQRRRHNYVPFCIQLLRDLATMNQLKDCIEKAKQRRQQQEMIMKKRSNKNL